MSEFDRTSHAKRIGMQPGETRNRSGNSKVRIKKSKLRQLEDKLFEKQDVALQIVDDILNERREVPSETATTAKWVLNSIVTISKACTAEEIANFNSRLKGKRDDTEEPEQTPEQIQSESKARLSLVYVSPDEDED